MSTGASSGGGSSSEAATRSITAPLTESDKKSVKSPPIVPNAEQPTTPARGIAPSPPLEGMTASRDPLEGIRLTEEYRAAWDLELWKGIQAERFTKQLEKQKARASADLQRLMQSKAKEQQLVLAQRASALDAREEKIKLEESQLLQRQQRVSEMEKDLRRTRQQLSDAQRRVEEEVRAQVRRANEDIAHKAKLLQERVLAAEQQTKKAEERQRQSHAEYLQLYESFNRFRAEQLTASQEVTSGSRLFQDMQTQLQLLRTQHSEEQRLALDRLEQKHQVELQEARTRIRELEEHNRRLSAALARRREQVHQLERESGLHPKRLRSSKEDKATSSTETTEAPTAPVKVPVSQEVVDLTQELLRLRRERVTLVDGSAGALTPSDSVIARMDERIREIEALLILQCKDGVQ